MRTLSVLWLCLLVAGCGMIARKEREEQIAAARAERDMGFANCKAQFPEGSKQYIAKTSCDAEAAKVIRPLANHPDLFDRYWTFKALIAERLQAGKLTVAEANQKIAENDSQIAAEEQQRGLANRTVGAQETMAAAQWRAAMPVSCTRIGNTTSCY